MRPMLPHQTSDVPVRPVEPEFRAAQRARVVLDYFEDGERHHAADDGWVRLDGPWVHLYADGFGHWQSWPAHTVVCIDWHGTLKHEDGER